MDHRHNRTPLLTALVISALLVFSGASLADLVEPEIKERPVKKTVKIEEPPLAVLINPDLPNRKWLIKRSNFKVHAAGRIEEQYDSNIYLADTELKADFITIMSPSVGFEMKAGKSRLSADYEISQYLFGTWHDQNHLDHRVRALGETKFGNHKITVSDTFRIFIDRAANENSLRLKENTNDFKGGISSTFTKFTIDAGYMNKLRTYDSHDLAMGQLTYEQRSYVDQSVYATFSYRAWPKTYLVLENDFGLINYYETSQLADSAYFNTLAGFKGKWTNKITVDLKAGFRYQHYYYSEIVSHKPYVGLIVRGGLEYNPTLKDRFVLSLERYNYESIYATNNYYTLNMIGLNYRHKFTNKWSAGAFGVYQIDLYPGQSTENGITATRYDSMMSGGANIRYDMKEWVSIEGKYEYRQKVSNFDTYDYIDNVVTLRGTVGF